MVAEEPRPEPESIWDHVFADRNIVAERSRPVPHVNRVYRGPSCSFPTRKSDAKPSGGNGAH